MGYNWDMHTKRQMKKLFPQYKEYDAMEKAGHYWGYVDFKYYAKNCLVAFVTFDDIGKRRVFAYRARHAYYGMNFVPQGARIYCTFMKSTTSDKIFLTDLDCFEENDNYAQSCYECD